MVAAASSGPSSNSGSRRDSAACTAATACTWAWSGTDAGCACTRGAGKAEAARSGGVVAAMEGVTAVIAASRRLNAVLSTFPDAVVGILRSTNTRVGTCLKEPKGCVRHAHARKCKVREGSHIAGKNNQRCMKDVLRWSCLIGMKSPSLRASHNTTCCHMEGIRRTRGLPVHLLPLYLTHTHYH